MNSRWIISALLDVSFLVLCRAYRIGQRRDVEVFRLISAGSIEENIYLRQIYKQVTLPIDSSCDFVCAFV